jgi:hypothetical protein
VFFLRVLVLLALWVGGLLGRRTQEQEDAGVEEVEVGE